MPPARVCQGQGTSVNTVRLLLRRAPAGMKYLRRELPVALPVDLVKKRTGRGCELIEIDAAIVPEIDQRRCCRLIFFPALLVYRADLFRIEAAIVILVRCSEIGPEAGLHGGTRNDTGFVGIFVEHCGWRMPLFRLCRAVTRTGATRYQKDKRRKDKDKRRARHERHSEQSLVGGDGFEPPTPSV